jgi:protein-tyrosine kinase
VKTLVRKGRKDRQEIKELKERSLITHHHPKSPISEQYRTVRTNIQFSSVDQDFRTIMVTSAGPAAGKSTTVANLAVVMAQQGKKVLLIDADMRKPTVHYTFMVSNTKGLTNVLTRQLELLEAVRATEIDNLHVLTSGPIPPNPSELLASKAMSYMLEKALDEYDVVLFDTPPVLAVTDAQVLANICDGVVFVISSGKTESEMAIKAKELLEAAKAKILGVVLNRKKMKEGENYYYYGTN